MAATSVCALIIGRSQSKKVSANESAKSKSVELRASKDLWNAEEDDRIRDVSLMPVPPHRLLATVGDTLYMLDSQQRIIWKWSVGHGENIIDQPFVDSTGTIYGIALDGISFVLDASTGKEKSRDQMMGKAYYTGMKAYRADQYLIVTGLQGYRGYGHEGGDELEAYKGTQRLWKVEFPANAELQVLGERIYAVTRKKGSAVVEEIEVPKK